MLEQFVKNHYPWDGLTLDKLVEDCVSWDRPYAGTLLPEQQQEQPVMN